MLSFALNSNLRNGVDFLLVAENKKTIQLKNNEWNYYNFGIFLLGENIILTVKLNSFFTTEYGHLKIKTSHLWIKHSSKIDCSGLGYPTDQGPGKGKSVCCGGGYGTKGEGNNEKETLLKQIHFGSGGGNALGIGVGGSGGGIIELIIEQQLINHGLIQSNGGDGISGGGNGSGGSILIELQCQSQSHSNKVKQTFGTITCIGKNQNEEYKGGKGRIAIYGIELPSDDILKIDPIPFNRIHK
ncbi:tenascin XB-like protein [Reticulomyxa filosa]|uniref:Tenascin XB-like protein n=1 Tax=Reticulomyxa filosa TaxID=46433 RepID=X6LM13_RETFI|nr:tenascin XB-like protein [Reticulomyxa filosa]|eukprot:ETO02197.1 tenascin XB-like protein [Reticulomyxa filosa]